LREIGDGTLDPVWQRALLHHAVRLDDGTPAPPPHDEPYERLYELVAHLPPESEAARAVAESLPPSLPPGDYRNTVFARAVLEEFMLEWGYDYATPPPTMWRNPALFSRSATFRRSVRRRVPRAARIGGAAILRLSRTRA
jgi:hypothetical protein